MGKLIDNTNINLATGSALDYLGNLIGIPRPEGTYPVVEVVFSIDAINEDNIIIPENTILTTTEDDIVYYTTESCIINAGTLNTSVTAKAQHIGTSDIVNKNSITKIVSTINTNVKVYVNNPTVSTGGTLADDDYTYRLRLKKWSTTLKRGTKNAFEYYLATVDGLNGYRIVPNWDGTGTVKVIVSPNTQYMVDTIATGLYEDVQCFDDDVTVEGVTPITININCRVNVTIDETYTILSDTEKENLIENIKMAIEYYIDGGKYINKNTNNSIVYPGLKIGEDFIPWKCSIFINDFLATAISDPNTTYVQDIQFDPILKPNNDTDAQPILLPQYIPIEDNQKATLQKGYWENMDHTLSPTPAGTINITLE